MRLRLEKVKQNLLESWLFETYRISALLNNDDGEPVKIISDQVAIWIKECFIQSQKIFHCLTTIQNSSEFRDFITRLETPVLQLTQTASKELPCQRVNSLFFTPKKDPAQEHAMNAQLEMILKVFLSLDGDLHPHNFDITHILEWDRFDEKNSQVWRTSLS